MLDEEKAKIILENLGDSIQIDWNFKELYLKAIENGLKEIKEKEPLRRQAKSGTEINLSALYQN